MTLLERRRALMSQNTEKYIFVEYIQSTGKEWIDTGFIPNGNTRVEIDFQLMSITASFIFGSRTSGSTNAYTLNMSSGGDLVTAYGSSNAMTLTGADVLRHSVNKYHRTTYLDGELVNQTTKQTFTCPGSLELLACYNNGTKGYLPSMVKLYSCQIYDNGKLVRDFVPCYRKGDGVGGLYDIANDKFYTNSGTGNFILGGVV